jgi:hypothetical protein
LNGRLIKGKYQFADKSLFIKDIIGDGADVILITRPRRFGKTLNLSMLRYFLQKDYSQDMNLFEKLAISEDQEFCTNHQNQYPVIFISFKDINQSNYADAYSGIKTLISDLYTEHQYLFDDHEDNILHEQEKAVFHKLLYKEGDKSEVEEAIKKLAIYLTRKFNKSPIILIDEYDTPIQEAYLNDYYQDMIKLMRSLLGQALKDNSCLSKAVLTGITRISQESLFSGLNNLEVYSLLREEYGQYFGFTEDEVSKLIAETQQEVSLSAIKKWYNGYQIGKYVLYNPWSIIKCLKNHGKLEPYWKNTSSNGLIKKLLTQAKPDVKKQFEELLQGHSIEQPLSENLIFSDIETKTEALWSLLLYAGYLKVLSSKMCGNRLMAKIMIPNREVSFVYDEIVEQWFIDAVSLDSYYQLMRSLSDGDMDKLKMHLSKYIMQSGSFFDFDKNTSEQVFHVFILGLIVGLRDHYIIQSNHEAGLGRSDVMMIPKNKEMQGIILEFKTSDVSELFSKAEEALQQIKDKKYVESFHQHNINSVLLIGLSFCGKQMELVHETIKI